MQQIKNILILDTETTGLEIDKGHKLIEVAAILYNVEHQTILQQASTLYPSVYNPAYYVNKIKPGATVANYPHLEATDFINEMSLYADIIVAHNADFDKNWIGTSLILDSLRYKTWVCTKNDFEWPEECSGARKLIEIAVSLDVTIANAHRALSDCQLLAYCFSKVNDLEQRFLEALQPKDKYCAHVPFELRHLPKSAGFEWEPSSKLWVKKLSEKQAANLDFKVAKVGGLNEQLRQSVSNSPTERK